MRKISWSALLVCASIVGENGWGNGLSSDTEGDKNPKALARLLEWHEIDSIAENIFKFLPLKEALNLSICSHTLNEIFWKDKTLPLVWGDTQCNTTVSWFQESKISESLQTNINLHLSLPENTFRSFFEKMKEGNHKDFCSTLVSFDVQSEPSPLPAHFKEVLPNLKKVIQPYQIDLSHLPQISSLWGSFTTETQVKEPSLTVQYRLSLHSSGIERSNVDAKLKTFLGMPEVQQDILPRLISLQVYTAALSQALFSSPQLAELPNLERIYIPLATDQNHTSLVELLEKTPQPLQDKVFFFVNRISNQKVHFLDHPILCSKVVEVALLNLKLLETHSDREEYLKPLGSFLHKSLKVKITSSDLTKDNIPSIVAQLKEKGVSQTIDAPQHVSQHNKTGTSHVLYFKRNRS